MKANTLRARFFTPPPQLSGCFTSFYLLEVDAEAVGERFADLLHPEWGNLRFFQGATPETAQGNGAVLTGTPFTATGPSSRAVAFTLPITRMWGVGLLPQGWARFMDVPARELADTVHDGLRHPAYAHFIPLLRALEAAQGSSDEAQAEILGRFFIENYRSVRAADQIAAVHRALVDPAVHNAAELAAHAGLAARSLERLCARYFGFPPQLLIRRQRMMRTLAAFMLAERATWSQVIDLHYADHAHFTREFQAFMAMSPRDYAERDHPILGAFMAERARVLGSPVQTLDPPGTLAIDRP